MYTSLKHGFVWGEVLPRSMEALCWQKHWVEQGMHKVWRRLQEEAFQEAADEESAGSRGRATGIGHDGAIDNSSSRRLMV